MRLRARQSATFAFIGSAIVGSAFVSGLPAQALPLDQIVQKLEPVPVFMIIDDKGVPLVATILNGNKKHAIVGIFIKEKDAEEFVDQLKTKNPDLAKTAKVIPVSLGKVYKLEQANESKPDAPTFTYVPEQQDVKAALSVLQQNGQKVNRFSGTPLFVAKTGKNKDYLSIKQNNQEEIPFFFNQNELQSLVERFKQQKPNIASTVTIEVVSLEDLLQTLKTRNNAGLSEVVLVPPKESLDYVRSLQSNQNQFPPSHSPSSTP